MKHNNTISWKFQLRGSFVKSQDERIKDIKALVKALGGHHLTCIGFRDSNCKLYASHVLDNGYEDEALKDIMNVIKERLQKDEKLYFVELIKR